VKRPPEVSVVLVAYGSFDERRIELAIESILAQGGVGFEVVLVDGNRRPTLNRLSSRSRVEYRFVGESMARNGLVNTGAIRNHGVICSRHPLLYLTDADIMMRRPDFLASVCELLEHAGEQVLIRPPMRRLLLEHVDEFWERYERRGFAAALESLDFTHPHVATPNGERRPLRLVRPRDAEPHESWTTTEEQYEEYRRSPQLRRFVPQIFTGTRHWGGVALRREQFERVGGYSSCFYGWGNEDTDLQWKLGGRFGNEFFPQEDAFEVVHLDHEKPYFEPARWERNREAARGRREAGAESAIREDKETYELTRRRD